jgi:hypothetical protein
VSFHKFALAKYIAALHSEWDAIVSVYNLMDWFPNLPVPEHLFGQHDLEINYANLPLDAQMNTQADALTTMELTSEEESTCIPYVITGA